MQRFECLYLKHLSRITNWPEVKKSGKYPFEQLPVLEVGNVTIAQSIAIARYLAREYGM